MVFKTAKNFFLNRIIPILLVGLILVLSVPDTVFASSTTDNQATDEDLVASSMYAVSTALTDFANNVVGPNANDKHVDTGTTGTNAHKLVELSNQYNVTLGSAGAIVGYTDTKQNATYIMENKNHSSSSASYDAYENIGDDGHAYAYTRYGRLLNDLGIDSVGNPASTGMGRTIGGLVMEGSHLLSQVVPSLFNFSLGVLDVVNPFRFLINSETEANNTVMSVGGTAGDSTLEDGTELTMVNPFEATGDDNFEEYDTNVEEGVGTTSDIGGETELQLENELNGTNRSALNSSVVGNNVTSTVNSITGNSVFKTITGWTTTIYIQLRAIGMWIILPLLLAFFLSGLLLGHDTSGTGGRVVRFLTRFLFVIIGIPILGLMYTAFLGELSEEINIDEPSSRVIACTFCDFSDWVTNARLDIPDTLPAGAVASEITDNSGESGEATGDTYRQVREIIYQINYKVLKNESGGNLLDSNSGLGLTGSHGNNYDMTGGMYDRNGLITTSVAGINRNGGALSTFNALNALMSSYQNGDTYTAPTWESSVHAVLTSDKYSEYMGSSQSTAEASTNKKTVYQMYYDTDSVDDWMNREITANGAIFAGTGGNEEALWAAKQGTNTSFNIFSNGGNFGNDNEFITINDNVASGNTIILYDASKNGNYKSLWGNATDPGYVGGLSTISMYNYLESAFNTDNIVVYSASTTTSEYTRLEHYSVNMAGTGALGIGFAVNCASCLVVYVILGFVYCLGMAWDVLKNGFKMLIHVPVALLGAVSSIIQVILIVVGMILEILVTMLLYKIVMEFIFSLASLIEQPIMNFFEGLNTSGTAIGGLFANTTDVSIVQQLSDSRTLFAVGLGIACLLVIAVGIAGIRLNRVLLTAWAFAWQKLYGLIIFDVWKDEYWKLMAEEKSLYVWDDIGLTIENLAEKYDKSIDDWQLPAVEGGMA